MKQHYPKKGLLLWKQKLLIIPLFLAILFSTQTYGQAYVHISKLLSSAGVDLATTLIKDDAGNFYLTGSMTANNWPMTIPSTATGTAGKTVLFKFDPDGNVIFSRYLTVPSGGSIPINKMVYDNGKLYILGTTSISNLPTTDGSVYKGGTGDAVYSVVNANSGAIETTVYLGGSAQDANGEGLVVENGFVYVSFTTSSSDIPVTTGPAFTVQYDHVVMKLTLSGGMVYSTYTGQSSNTGAFASATSFAVHNGIAALGLIVNQATFPTTDGSTFKGGRDWGVVKINADGSTAYRRLIGGALVEETPTIAINNGEVYISGSTLSGDYPVTDGSSFTGSNKFHVLTKLSTTGSVLYSRMLAGIPTNTSIPPMISDNGNIYIMGSCNGGNPVVHTTDGTSGGNYLMRLNASNGQPVYSTTFATFRGAANRTGVALTLLNGQAIVMTPGTNATTANYLTTDGFARQGGGGSYLAIFSPEGKFTFGTWKLSGAGANEYNLLAASGNRIYAATYYLPGNTVPLTDPNYAIVPQQDISLAGFTLCPVMPTQNDLAPMSQTICAGGFTQALTGNKVAFGSDAMPMLYRNGATFPQQEIVARYQWQTAAASTGPWTNIAGVTGTQKDFAPPSLADTRYYRRLVLPPAGCGETPVSTSAVAEVVVGADASPLITSTVYNTCAGTPVNIEATVTGGTAPYTYSWDNGIASVTNTATVTPTANSVYTISVTDGNGCEQKGQVVVNAYAANAGPDVNSCAGKPVRLGVAPPAGLAGVVYSWTPTAGLDDPTIAQPLATPASNTTYTLSMTVPVSGGGTCNTTDDVNVTLVAGPTNANFAGADVAVCKEGTVNIGSFTEPGFTYTWSPGNYLSSVTNVAPTFSTGGELPNPNPIRYTLTASINGCSFTDDVEVAVLTADAGEDNVCGPRPVGVADPIPGVTGKTFLWEVVSGPGTITGATNTATTTVSESLGGSTTYRLTVSYLGTNCTDIVTVPECGTPGTCKLDSIEVIAPHGCPSTAFGAVTLRAVPFTLNPANWTYTWSSLPAGGLSTTTGSTTTLTDNVERDVTITITSKLNPAVSCSYTIRVNDASWALPVFTAQDHAVCAATPVSIGAAPVAGYSYSWTAVTGGDQFTSNPTVTPASTTRYIATVKEDATGCTVKDTADVIVRAVVADPGADWTTCSNAVIQLGSPALPGYTYSWTPAVAGYQDGTDATFAQPRVLVATTQDFTLRATDVATGCFKDSTVHIVIDPSSTLPTMTNQTICRGASVQIGHPGVGNATYAWSPATGLSSTTVAQPMANPTSSQTYTLIVTYYDLSGNPTCPKTGTVDVTVNGPEITMSDDAVCPSAAPYVLSTGVSVSGTPTAYAWTPASRVTATANFNTTVVANPTTTPATYQLVVRDAAGCADTATRTISSSVVAPIAGSNATVCVGSSIVLGDVSNTGTITWTPDQTIAGTLSSASDAAPVFTPAAGDANKTIVFTVTQDNGGGCVGVSSVTIQVKSFTLPVIPVQTVCENASCTIGVAAQAAVSYSWFPTTGLTDPLAATTTASNIMANTSYTLTAVNVDGCVATTQAVVGVNPVPAPQVTVADVVNKVGRPAMAFNPQINPAVGTYTYNWTPANKMADPYIANAVSTENQIGTYNYSLAVTDGNGCTSVAPATLRIENIDILPVTLASFTATTKDCGVSLNWKVESASNFSHFIVERSVGGGNYVAVRKVWYEYNRVNYNHQDAETGNGKWSYRLKLVDIDGQFSYSKVVFADVKCAVTKNSLKIYPNPASGIVYINSSKPVKTVMVYTLTGGQALRKDYAQNAASVVTLPVSNLVTGVYLVQVIAQDGTSQASRLVKE